MFPVVTVGESDRLEAADVVSELQQRTDIVYMLLYVTVLCVVECTREYFRAVRYITVLFRLCNWLPPSILSPCLHTSKQDL